MVEARRESLRRDSAAVDAVDGEESLRLFSGSGSASASSSVGSLT